MKRLLISSCAIGLSVMIACAPVSDADEAIVQSAPEIAVTEPDVEDAVPLAEEVSNEKIVDDQAVMQPAENKCSKNAKQGGLIVCQLPVGARVSLNGQAMAIVGESGLATIGLKQNAASPAIVSWSIDGVEALEKFEIPVAARKDDFRELTGMNCDKVDARTPEQKKHAGESWVKKVDAFASLNAPVSKQISFLKPADGPYSSPFGPTRHYTGVSEITGKKCESTSVHRGLDMAVPVGTDLIAPMGGTVILGDPDLYYEGGSIFLDHGYGLVSVFMHLSQVDVAAGQSVQTGERLGATGNTGRTTGPHLHWAVKWRNTARDDRNGDFYIDPAIVLELADLDAQ